MHSLRGGYAQRPEVLPVQRGYSARFRGPISCSTFNNATVFVQHGMLANVEGLTVVASQYMPFGELSTGFPGGMSAVFTFQYEPVAASMTSCSLVI